jgi:hypothetical protein
MMGPSLNRTRCSVSLCASISTSSFDLCITTSPRRKFQLSDKVVINFYLNVQYCKLSVFLSPSFWERAFWVFTGPAWVSNSESVETYLYCITPNLSIFPISLNLSVFPITSYQIKHMEYKISAHLDCDQYTKSAAKSRAWLNNLGSDYR